MLESGALMAQRGGATTPQLGATGNLEWLALGCADKARHWAVSGAWDRALRGPRPAIGVCILLISPGGQVLYSTLF